MDEFINIFNTYQTFIVGILGFTGVILTIVTNARLSHRQYLSQITHESTFVRKALIKELELVKDILIARNEHLKKIEGVATIPNHQSSQVYLQLLPKIGLLKDSEIKEVISTYQVLDELPFRLSMISEFQGDFNQTGYITVQNSKLDLVISIHNSFSQRVESTLNLLKINSVGALQKDS